MILGKKVRKSISNDSITPLILGLPSNTTKLRETKRTASIITCRMCRGPVFMGHSSLPNDDVHDKIKVLIPPLPNNSERDAFFDFYESVIISIFQTRKEFLSSQYDWIANREI